jgi:hypothetical protein
MTLFGSSTALSYKKEGALGPMSLHCFDEAVENTLSLQLLLLAGENRQSLRDVTIAPGQRVAKPATEHGLTVRSMHYK